MTNNRYLLSNLKAITLSKASSLAFIDILILKWVTSILKF